MKYFFLKSYAAICCVIVMVSCSNETIEEVKTAKMQMIITATYDTNVQSRTSLGSDLSVLWAQDDALSVFDNNDNNAFSITSGMGTSSAKFNGTAAAADKYYAVYPYQSDATISGSVISNVEIPSQQIATINSFDPKANVMTAISNKSNDFEFKNICSYAKITTTTACRRIIITAGEGDKISGEFSMVIVDDGTAILTPTKAMRKVTVVPSAGESFAAGTYFVAIKPGEMSSLNVKCISADNVIFERSINSTVNVFTRGTVIDFGEVSAQEGWTESTLEYQSVDLGVSVQWSTTNVGAYSSEEFGNYFAWGELTGCGYKKEGVLPAIMDSYASTWTGNTNPGYISGHEKSDYIWTDYKWCIDEENNMTKYCYTSSYGTVDDRLKLEEEDDVATVTRGSGWRLPTTSEHLELLNNCYWVWTASYDDTNVPGYIVYKVKSATDKGVKVFKGNTPSSDYTLSDPHIFLPAAGVRGIYMFDGIGEYCGFWSSSLYTYNSSGAWHLAFSGSYVNRYGSSRCLGQIIRPVYKE